MIIKRSICDSLVTKVTKFTNMYSRMWYKNISYFTYFNMGLSLIYINKYICVCVYIYIYIYVKKYMEGYTLK